MQLSISLVSYLNAYPYRLGLEKQFLPFHPEVSISYDNPADCAKKLSAKTAQIGLVPISAIKEIPDVEVITNLGIGATTLVDSVLLISKVPLKGIKKVHLDYQSRTSVALIKILFKEFWKQEVEFINAPDDYLLKITGNVAGVVIGDRALAVPAEYIKIDLAQAWHQFSGLPFIFANWVSNVKLSSEFLESFTKALEWGVDNRQKFYPFLEKKFNGIDVFTYLNSRIDFKMSDKHKQGAEKFLSYPVE